MPWSAVTINCASSRLAAEPLEPVEQRHDLGIELRRVGAGDMPDGIDRVEVDEGKQRPWSSEHPGDLREAGLRVTERMHGRPMECEIGGHTGGVGRALERVAFNSALGETSDQRGNSGEQPGGGNSGGDEGAAVVVTREREHQRADHAVERRLVHEPLIHPVFGDRKGRVQRHICGRRRRRKLARPRFDRAGVGHPPQPRMVGVAFGEPPPERVDPDQYGPRPAAEPATVRCTSAGTASKQCPPWSARTPSNCVNRSLARSSPRLP